MRWECSRGCGSGGSKLYATAEEANRYARGLESDRPTTGGRMPLVSTLPLRLFRRTRKSGR